MAGGSESAGGHTIRLADGSSIELRVFPDDPRLSRDVQRVAAARLVEDSGDRDRLRAAIERSLRAWYPSLAVHERTDFAAILPDDEVWYVLRDGHVGPHDERRDRLHAALSTARDVAAQADATLNHSQQVAAEVEHDTAAGGRRPRPSSEINPLGTRRQGTTMATEPEAGAFGGTVDGAAIGGALAPATTSVDLLAAATRRLAETIAKTERLAQDRAELLRTVDVSKGGRAMASQPIGLISLSEAARQTGRHPEVLRRWCIDGRLPAVRVGRTWAISHESLASLMSHRARSRPRLTGDAPRR